MRIPLKGLYRKLLYFSCEITGTHQVYFKAIGVKVGKNCRVYTDYFGSEPFLVSIGNNVTIAAGVRFITHDGSAWLVRDDRGRRYVFQPIEIGDNVFVGMNCIIMPGVKIEKNVVVAAGSVVTKSVPAGSVVAGVPARIINSFDGLKEKMLAEYMSEEDWKRAPGTEDQKIRALTTHSFKPYLTREREFSR